MSYQNAMNKALENTYILLAMMDKVGRDENISNRMAIAPAMSRAEDHLERLWKGEEVQYRDFQDVMDVASQAAHQIWNPRAADFLHRKAIHAINNQARAENWHRVDIERTPYIQKEPLVSIEEDVIVEAVRIAEAQELTGRGAAATLAGAEAIRHLAETRAQIQKREGQKVNYNERALPKINLENADRFTFNAWAHCLGTIKALPTSDVLQPLLHQAKTQGEIPDNVRKAVANSWIKERPEIPEDWICFATEALSQAATSEKITGCPESAQHVAEQLANTSAFQSSVHSGYQDLAHTYSVSERLDTAINGYHTMKEKVSHALEEIETVIVASEDLSASDTDGPMNQADWEKFKVLKELQAQLAEKLDDLPTQLEELAQRIRASDPESGQAMRLG